MPAAASPEASTPHRVRRPSDPLRPSRNAAPLDSKQVEPQRPLEAPKGSGGPWGRGALPGRALNGSDAPGFCALLSPSRGIAAIPLDSRRCALEPPEAAAGCRPMGLAGGWEHMGVCH